MSSPTSLAVTVAHAVTYLTRPLATARALPPATLATLQAALEAHLAAAFVATGWAPADPARGARRRVLSFAPATSLPPRPVWRACLAAGVDWNVWATLMGPLEFHLSVDPGCVAVRLPASCGATTPSRVVTVWAAEDGHTPAAVSRVANSSSSSSLSSLSSSAAASPATSTSSLVPAARKTPAQLLIEADAADDDALFSALAAELHAPTWKSPLAEAFPSSALATEALLTPHVIAPPQLDKLRVPARRPAMHSRSSSRSSVVSAAPSFLSDDSSVSSCASLSSVGSASSLSSAASSAAISASTSGSARRNRAPRVFIDTSKNEVTPYDGGKTTVLTGGVMLGAAPARSSRAATGRRTQRF